MRLRADADFGHAEAVGRLAQIHQCGRCDIFLAVVPEGRPPFARRLEAPGEEAVPRHFAQTPAQRQHADVGVRTPFGLDGQRHGRVLTVELHDLRLDHAFAFHRNQRGRETERAAYLELRDFAGLVILLLGQHVDAVMVFAAEPEFALFRDVDRARGLALTARLVGGRGDQFDLTGFLQFGFALQQAACIAGAAADASELLHVGLVVVGVEAADHAFAAGRRDARDRIDLQLHAGLRLAGEVERQRLEPELPVRRDPALGLEPGDDCGRPECLGAAKGLDLAVRVRIGRFEQQFARRGRSSRRRQNIFDRDLACAVAIERQS